MEGKKKQGIDQEAAGGQHNVSSQPQPLAQTGAKPDSHQQPIKLLLVDDEVDFLQATTKALSRRGFAVSQAQDGRAALELAMGQAFDLIVMDVKMPGLDGVEVFRKLKHHAWQTPVILLTGHGTVQQAFKASKEGVVEYLAKPCEVEKLVAAARRAIDQGRQPLAAPPEGQEIRVLFVDDEIEFLESLSAGLRRRAMTVTTAASGAEAEQFLARQVFDVALIDIKMPGMDGMALLKRIKQVQPLTEVIVLTGHPSTGLAVEGLKDGAFDFLMKPQNIEALVDKISQAFKQRQQRAKEQQERLAREILAGKPD